MNTSHPSTPLTVSALLLLTALFCSSAQANLVDNGNGTIYDPVTNVTWISDGYAFTNDIASTTNTPTADPYTGPLLGTVVTPSLGAPHTLAANDFSYQASLGRWTGSWWAATAWADSFSYSYTQDNQTHTLSDWRLPTTAEAQSLLTQLGSAYGPYPTTPFAYMPPFYWTSTQTSATNVDNAQPLFGSIANLTIINPANGGINPRYSNVLAVVPGNVAAVPIPAAVWLFGSALAGMGVIGRRREKATA